MSRQRKQARRQRGPILLIIAALMAFAWGAAPLGAANIDLVVMVDTSESMFPYFDNLMNYLVQDLLTEKLHRGDTFHLLSFSSLPEVEISLGIDSEEAAQRAFGRILLLNALGRYTDLVAALQFLQQYTKELPETNAKQVILITDGVHDPPPGSVNRGTLEDVRRTVAALGLAMKNAGWTFNILKVPPEPRAGEEGKQSYLADLAQSLGVDVVPYKVSDKDNVTGRATGFPSLAFPPNLGKVGNRFAAPFKVKNWKAEPIIVRLSGIQSDGIELLEKPVSATVPSEGEATLEARIRLPLSYPLGAQSPRVSLVFEEDVRISPTTGTLSFTYTGKGGLPIPRLTFLYVLYIVLGIVVLYLLVRLFLFMRKKLHEAPVTGLARGGLAADTAERAGGRNATQQSAQQSALHAARSTPARRRTLIPLLPVAGAAPAIPAKRVRPTVTSLRRSLPRKQMQQASLPPLIEMRVDQQNHRVGFRNVHRIPAGNSRSVGGRFSSYLVFLVPVPANIGQIRNVDGTYVFTPLRPELFPAVKGAVEDCLDTDIPFVTPKGMELTLRFRTWVSQLDEINALMRSARSEGY
jgi:Mg-chelatase subunit ChlD